LIQAAIQKMKKRAYQDNTIKLNFLKLQEIKTLDQKLEEYFINVLSLDTENAIKVYESKQKPHDYKNLKNLMNIKEGSQPSLIAFTNQSAIRKNAINTKMNALINEIVLIKKNLKKEVLVGKNNRLGLAQKKYAKAFAENKKLVKDFEIQNDQDIFNINKKITKLNDYDLATIQPLVEKTNKLFYKKIKELFHAAPKMYRDNFGSEVSNKEIRGLIQEMKDMEKTNLDTNDAFKFEIKKVTKVLNS
jgi:hypothetical protein